MTNNCIPSTVIPTVDDTRACEMLGALRAALYQLMTGQTKSVVRSGDNWLEFQSGSVAELQREVRRLEIICGAGGGRARAARVVGPYSHRG